jgi:hypothetical protein
MMGGEVVRMEWAGEKHTCVGREVEVKCKGRVVVCIYFRVVD